MMVITVSLIMKSINQILHESGIKMVVPKRVIQSKIGGTLEKKMVRTALICITIVCTLKKSLALFLFF